MSTPDPDQDPVEILLWAIRGEGIPMSDPTPDPDQDAVEILLSAIRSNYTHPSGIWCQGCSMTFDAQAILADIREKGWELRPR